MLYTYEEIIALSPEEFSKNWDKVAQSSLELLGFKTVPRESEDTEDPNQ